MGKALLIVNLQLLLLAPLCAPQKVDRGLKSVDRYWEETGLGTQELEALLSEESCYSNLTSFLACINALGQMAEKYNLVLGLDGNFRSLTPWDVEQRASEKEQMLHWKSRFADTRRKIDFLKRWKNLETEHVGSQEKAYVISLGINGFLSVYKDPHTYIMPLALYEEVVANSESRNTNVGFIAKRSKGELVVRKVFEGSSAARAGVKKGDRIFELNGEPVEKLPQSRVSEILKMKESARLSLKVVRNGKKLYLEILRTENSYPSVVSKNLREIGLLTIHKFSKDVCRQTRQELMALKQENIKGLLLDLRDNPGGQVEEAACVINLFVQKGSLLFETRYLDVSKPSDHYFAEEDAVYRGPLAVLINSGSASASEIVAGSLRDLNRAKLIGERSFGKGSFQDGRVWGPNPKIALFETEGLYYFPSGWTPQLVGLQPDIAVAVGSAEYPREEDLFFNPVVPVDSWSGPQSLSWLTELECENEMMAALADPDIEDPQVRKAKAILNCGAANDRNGSL